jgi:hypothetical protein
LDGILEVCLRGRRGAAVGHDRRGPEEGGTDQRTHEDESGGGNATRRSAGSARAVRGAGAAIETVEEPLGFLEEGEPGLWSRGDRLIAGPFDTLQELRKGASGSGGDAVVREGAGERFGSTPSRSGQVEAECDLLADEGSQVEEEFVPRGGGPIT